MLRGIDVSHWNSSELDITGVDFVICKATQGTTFIDNTFARWMERTSGMLRGAFHFADGGNPEREAEFFNSTTRNYLGDFAPVLDFEIETDNPVQWVERWISRYYELTGIWAVLYTGYQFPYPNMLNLFDDSWIPDFCPLWVARYPQPTITRWIDRQFSGNTGAWGKPDIWQFTSELDLHGAPVDANIAYMSEVGFKALYGVDDMTVKELLDTQIATPYGNITVRDALAWGYSYARDMQPVVFDLQKRVKELEKRIGNDRN